MVQIEFALNDNDGGSDIRSATWMNNPMRRGYERLVRKILRLANNPAILVVHYYSLRWVEMNIGGHSFWFTPEDEIDVIAKYYALPAVSFRNTFYNAMMADKIGFRPEDILKDHVHPNELGSQYLAYVVVSYFEALLSVMPDKIAPHKFAALPPPMLPDNNGSQKTVCSKGDRLKRHMLQSKGWQWVEGEKSGWEASSPGSHLQLATGFIAHDAGGVVTVGYLHGFRKMGKAEITCEGGCACKPFVIDAHQDMETAQQRLVHIAVTKGNVYDGDCIINIEVQAESSSLGHNFKIMNLATGDGELQPQDQSAYDQMT